MISTEPKETRLSTVWPLSKTVQQLGHELSSRWDKPSFDGLIAPLEYGNTPVTVELSK